MFFHVDQQEANRYVRKSLQNSERLLVDHRPVWTTDTFSVFVCLLGVGCRWQRPLRFRSVLPRSFRCSTKFYVWIFARPRRLPALPDRTRKYPSVKTIKAHIPDRVASHGLDLLSLYSDSGVREYMHS